MRQRSPLPILPDSLLVEEHAVLLRSLGRTQSRCSTLIAQQQAEIAHLQRECMLLRAQLVIQASAWAWSIDSATATQPSVRQKPIQAVVDSSLKRASAEAAVCQSDCIAQGYRWREQDACLRQGGACLLADIDQETPSCILDGHSPMPSQQESIQANHAQANELL